MALLPLSTSRTSHLLTLIRWGWLVLLLVSPSPSAATTENGILLVPWPANAPHSSLPEASELGVKVNRKEGRIVAVYPRSAWVDANTCGPALPEPERIYRNCISPVHRPRTILFVDYHSFAPSRFAVLNRALAQILSRLPSGNGLWVYSFSGQLHLLHAGESDLEPLRGRFADAGNEPLRSRPGDTPYPLLPASLFVPTANQQQRKILQEITQSITDPARSRANRTTLALIYLFLHWHLSPSLEQFLWITEYPSYELTSPRSGSLPVSLQPYTMVRALFFHLAAQRTFQVYVANPLPDRGPELPGAKLFSDSSITVETLQAPETPPLLRSYAASAQMGRSLLGVEPISEILQPGSPGAPSLLALETPLAPNRTRLNLEVFQRTTGSTLAKLQPVVGPMGGIPILDLQLAQLIGMASPLELRGVAIAAQPESCMPGEPGCSLTIDLSVPLRTAFLDAFPYTGYPSSYHVLVAEEDQAGKVVNLRAVAATQPPSRGSAVRSVRLRVNAFKVHPETRSIRVVATSPTFRTTGFVRIPIPARHPESQATP